MMTDTLPPITRSLPIALIRAREGVMAPIREMLYESGITEQQWRVLRVLAERGVMDANSLARQASLLMPSLTRIVSTMRGKGLLTQTRDDHDKRRQLIDITDADRAIITQHKEKAASIVKGFKHSIGDANYETLLDLLSMLDPNKTDSSL